MIMDYDWWVIYNMYWNDWSYVLMMIMVIDLRVDLVLNCMNSMNWVWWFNVIIIKFVMIFMIVMLDVFIKFMLWIYGIIFKYL